jgi:hypothetical protein
LEPAGGPSFAGECGGVYCWRDAAGFDGLEKLRGATRTPADIASLATTSDR